MNDIEEKAIPQEDPVKRRIREEKEAKQNEIRQLIEFIGGFDKWGLLNNDCRLEVLKYLDYGSRCCLGLCSKTDQALVQKLPIRVYSLKISEAKPCRFIPSAIKKLERTIEVRAEFSEEYSPQHCIKRLFYQQRRDTSVITSTSCSGSRYRKQTYLKATNNIEAAWKYLEKCMRKCNNQIDELKVVMTGDGKRFESSNIPQLKYCKSAEFGIDNVEGLSWWLQKLPEKIDKVEVRTFRDAFRLRIPREVMNAPQIVQASHLKVDCDASVSDEQFLKLQAKSMFLNLRRLNDGEITGDAVNQFLKKWARGEIQDFKDLYVRGFNQHNPHNIILNGLEFRQWDEEFRAENKEFCESFQALRFPVGSYYQVKSSVNPYESVTLLVDIFLEIQKTGHETVEKDGRKITTYSEPELTYARQMFASL